MRNLRKPINVTQSLPDFDASKLESSDRTISQEFWIDGNAQAIIDAQNARTRENIAKYQPTQIIEQTPKGYDLATVKFVAVTFFLLGFISSSIFMMLTGILYLLDFYILK